MNADIGNEEAAAEATPAASVDQIRDIIFGAQMKEYERRFGELEERLLAESHALREDLRQRFEQLETRLREHVRRLEESVSNEASERGSAAAEIHSKLGEARAEIHSKLDELVDRKTDRAALSRLLRDLAEQLDHGSRSAAGAG